MAQGAQQYQPEGVTSPEGPAIQGLTTDSGPGPGQTALAQLLAGGVAPAPTVLGLLYAHPTEIAAMLAQLHTTLGNAFVQEVLALDAGGRGLLVDKPAETTPLPAPTEAGPGLKAFAELLARGTPDVDAVLLVLDSYPGERELLTDRLHGLGGT